MLISSAVPKRLRALTEGGLRPAARFKKSLKGTLFTSSSVAIPLESRTQWFHVVLVLPEYCCAPVCCSLIGGIPYQQEGIPDSFKHPKLLAKVSSWPTIAWVEDDKQIDSWVLAKIPIWTFTSAAFVLQVVLSTGFRLAEPFLAPLNVGSSCTHWKYRWKDGLWLAAPRQPLAILTAHGLRSFLMQFVQWVPTPVL